MGVNSLRKNSGVDMCYFDLKIYPLRSPCSWSLECPCLVCLGVKQEHRGMCLHHRETLPAGYPMEKWQDKAPRSFFSAVVFDFITNYGFFYSFEARMLNINVSGLKYVSLSCLLTLFSFSEGNLLYCSFLQSDIFLREVKY